MTEQAVIYLFGDICWPSMYIHTFNFSFLCVCTGMKEKESDRQTYRQEERSGERESQTDERREMERER